MLRVVATLQPSFSKLYCLKWLSFPSVQAIHILPKFPTLMRSPISIQRQINSLSTLALFSHASQTKICPPKPYPRKKDLATAMASEGGDSENISTTVEIEEDVEFGFKRSEMYSSNLAGTVGAPYERHLFLCYKSYESWPSRVENSEADLLPKLLAAAIKTRQAGMKVKTRLTICEGLDGGKLSDGDVLIFPDMINYRDIKESDVDSFVEDVLVNGNPWSVGRKDVLTGSYIFVCAHNNRDKRCGVCGPVLIEKFKEEIESKGLKDNVFVTACSHIGGHKYAGNAIIFNANTEGKIEGHWYGYVTPDDVPELLDQHIGRGEIIERIWRGQMGASVEKANGIQNQKLEDAVELNNHEENSQGSGSQEIKETISDCCQGGAGFSCCRGGSSVENLREEKVENSVENLGEEKVENSVENLGEEKVENSVENLREEKVENSLESLREEKVENSVENLREEKVENSVGNLREEKVENSVGNLREEKVAKSVGNLREEKVAISEGKAGKSSKWEQSDVLTAVGIIGAVVTVAVIYGFYRRSN